MNRNAFHAAGLMIMTGGRVKTLHDQRISGLLGFTDSIEVSEGRYQLSLLPKECDQE